MPSVRDIRILSRLNDASLPDGERFGELVDLLRSGEPLSPYVRGILADLFDPAARSAFVAVTKRRAGRGSPGRDDTILRYGKIANFVEARSRDGVKREAAIVEATRTFSVSRTAVFNALRGYQSFLKEIAKTRHSKVVKPNRELD